MIPSPDTIAAIATPPGRGGIGVVRVSGAAVPALAVALLAQLPPPRVATLATFRDARGEPLDEGLALYFPAPASYTGEHVLELHGHGGPAVLQLLLARCVELGARLAQPGEFTQRAFLNGKLDLAQAEGVADLIAAATATAARAAARSLTGEFSATIRGLVDALIELRMFTEATLDFPDEDVEFLRAADARARLAAIRAQLAAVQGAARAGALLRDGLCVVLVGEPNVGKSSLMNRLCGSDVAIVTAIPGTTRDAIASAVEIGGIPLTIVDTAGLRPTDEPIEALGIERTWAAVGRADLVLVLVDARAADRGLDAATAAILARLPATLPRVLVYNKIDLCAHAGDRAARVESVLDGEVGSGGADTHTKEGVTRAGCGDAAVDPRRRVWLSAKTGDGVDALRREILALAGAREDMEGAILARARHLEALREADAHLGAALGLFAQDAPPLELLAEELREAQTALAAITGEFTADDLLGVIFSRFCLGK
jgi:tRNA modification GTPase